MPGPNYRNLTDRPRVGRSDPLPVNEIERDADPLASYRPLRRLGTAVTASLAVYVVAILAAATSDVLDWRLTTAILEGHGVSDARLDLSERRRELVSIGFLGVYAATALIFLGAIYRLSRNARVLTNGGFAAPAGAVLWFFVPGLNFFMPYLAVQQIWRASVPSERGSWRNRPPSPLVKRWWAFWLFSWLAGAISTHLSVTAKTNERFRSAVEVKLIHGAINLVLAAITLLLVRRLASMQDERYAQLLRVVSEFCPGCGELLAGDETCPICGRQPHPERI